MRAYINDPADPLPIYPLMVDSNIPYADWVALKVKLIQEVRYVWDRHFEFELPLSDAEADQLYLSVGEKLFGTRANFDEYYF